MINMCSSSNSIFIFFPFDHNYCLLIDTWKEACRKKSKCSICKSYYIHHWEFTREESHKVLSLGFKYTHVPQKVLCLSLVYIIAIDFLLFKVWLTLIWSMIDINREWIFCCRAVQELKQLGEFFANTLDLTGMFYCHVPQKLCLEGFLNLSYFE